MELSKTKTPALNLFPTPGAWITLSRWALWAFVLILAQGKNNKNRLDNGLTKVYVVSFGSIQYDSFRVGFGLGVDSCWHREAAKSVTDRTHKVRVFQNKSFHCPFVSFNEEKQKPTQRTHILRSNTSYPRWTYARIFGNSLPFVVFISVSSHPL